MANKTDLINEVQGYLEANEFKASKKEVGLFVDAVLDSIQDVTVREGKLQIIGHGTYEVRERAAREGHNPSTGEKIHIEAKKVPAFKAGKGFKDLLK